MFIFELKIILIKSYFSYLKKKLKKTTQIKYTSPRSTYFLFKL